MSDKTALVILSEIVQSLEDVRNVAEQLRDEGGVRFTDEEIESQELTAKEVEEIEAEEQDVAGKLFTGCRKIEDEALAMIQLCCEFRPPL